MTSPNESQRARQRGGIVLRYGVDSEDGFEIDFAFVPADVAARVVEIGAITPVPGAHPPVRGVALVGVEVVTVLALGDHVDEPRTSYEPAADWPLPGADRAVLCHVGPQRVALVGATIVATGLFDVVGDAVAWRNALVPTLDVRALYAQAEAAIWAGRASPRPGLRPNSVRPASLRPPSARTPSLPSPPKEEPK